MKRTPLERKTPLRAKKQLTRGRPPSRSRAKSSSGSPKRSASSPNDFPEQTRLAVRARSGGRCEVRSRVCTGDASHIHHRKLRRHKDQRPVNALHVCSECHAHIHANVAKAQMMGWLIASWADPAEVPVRRGDWGR